MLYEKGINDGSTELRRTSCGRRVAAWVPMRDKGSQEPEMLRKSKWYLYQEAAAKETGNVDGCFGEAPASAKQAGVLHLFDSYRSCSPLNKLLCTP